MEKQFATYEIALALKGLGFNEKCFGLWTVKEGKKPKIYNDRKLNSNCVREDSCSAPIWQQIIDWFKEKYNITIDTSAEECEDGDSGDGPMFEYYIKDWNALRRLYSDIQYLTRESAREAVILKAIELIK